MLVCCHAEHAGQWLGCPNSCLSGYAADGYARVNGMGALATAFGVGELSALNGVAGAYSEYVPVVHIVGQPSTVSQAKGLMLHHSLGNGDFKAFSKMSETISVYVALLNNPSQIARQIDTALRECWIKSRPVYIGLPTDMVQEKVEGARLDTPIDLSLSPNDQESENYLVNVVLSYLEQARKPRILVDACASRFRVLPEVEALVRKSGLPTFVTPASKGFVDENLPNFAGIYAGKGSTHDVRSQIESSDLVLSIGTLRSDINTCGFSYPSTLNIIDFHNDSIIIQGSHYANVGMKGLLGKVVDRLDGITTDWVPSPVNEKTPDESFNSVGPAITHDWLWSSLSSWLQENDILLTETGTASIGIWQTRFPRGARSISQVIWASIGYTVGACQGASLAAQDIVKRGAANSRTILFVGDGSFQFAAQELSTMIRRKLAPIIFVICNNGYTLERYVHGWEADYNDIQPWRHRNLPDAFGGDKSQFRTYSVSTKSEMNDLFKNEEFSSANVLQLVELHMPMDDCPPALKIIGAASRPAAKAE